MTQKSDVIIVGAGAAGITAAILMAKTGLSVRILEARTRIGGRMLTIKDPATEAAIEMGAEFIHGRPAEIFDTLSAHNIPTNPVDGEFLRLGHGELESGDFFTEIDSLMEKMNDRGPDESFAEFLERCCREDNQEKIKEWARGYVTGFHAADPELISVHSLVKGMRAEEEIGGHQSFRMRGGYLTLLDIWREQLHSAGVNVELATSVKSIQWKTGNVEIEAEKEGTHAKYNASKILITLPLSLLQESMRRTETEMEGIVEFAPALSGKKDAVEKLVMGKVIRVTLCFRERFWDNLHIGATQETLANAGFLFSGEDWFPTWWTTMPEKLPVITGWAPFHCAERLADKNEKFVISKAIETLAKILRMQKQEIDRLLVSAYYHNWETDPYSRGAYSYVKAGGDTAQTELAAPIDNTLFFAGEATDFTGHHGTVHGAIRSGIRAAKEILAG